EWKANLLEEGWGGGWIPCTTRFLEFSNDEGEIRQRIQSPEDIDFQVPVFDYRKEAEPMKSAIAYVEEDKFQPFDFEKGPLLRAALLHVADDQFLFYYNMHHIVSDDRSMNVLMQDTTAIYQALVSGHEGQLPDLEVQYKDYSVWQTEQMQSGTYQDHRQYWLGKFKGELATIDLVSAGSRPKVKTNRGQSLQAYIHGKTAEALRSFVAVNGGSTFMVLLAAWNVLLHRYTSQKDIIVGVSLSGRDHADLENQIGFYINTVALRNEVDPEQTFAEFYARLTQDTLSDFENNKYQFDTLVEELDLSRDVSRSPVFDILLTLQNTHREQQVAVSAETLDHIEDMGSSLSKFDLDIEWREFQDAIAFVLKYNKDLFEEDFIKGLMTHFRSIVHAAVTQADTRIGWIDFLSSSEKNTLLKEFNDTDQPNEEQASVLDFFAAQVAEKSAEIAIECNGEQLSYGELDDRSNQIAHFLADEGIYPGDFVPVFLERSVDLVAAILGVWKCGGVYIPVDVTLPSERANYIIGDSGASLVLTARGLRQHDAIAGMKPLCIDGQDALSQATSDFPVEITVSSDAFIIYTSGSTGQPKGVVLSHGNLGAFLFDIKHKFTIANSRQAILASNGFDISLFELLNPLISGGTAVLLTNAEIRDMDTLLERLSAVNEFHAVPTLMGPITKAIGERGLQAKFKGLKEVYIGGDKVPTAVLEQMRSVFPDAIIRVLYGPTETSIFMTTKVFMPHGDTLDGTNIGTPHLNTQVLLLDGNHQLVPMGVVGELCVAGDQVGQGYLNKEELSAKKFVPHPWETGQSIYKTGDLARWTEDGDLIFVGRNDNQVKIRGHRIELGEIEQRLLSHEDITGSVVLVNGDQTDQRELVAYVVSKRELYTEELVSFLSVHLPSYMIPSYFVPLEEIPLTVNRKLYRKALPDPVASSIDTGIEYVAPSTDIEKKIAAIWESLLDREQIGILDNFFLIGGDSIKGIRIVSELRKTFDVKIDLASLFFDPTIKALSEEVANAAWEETELPEEEIVDKTVI
ncbi:MAG: amino acid adenylation domain-containing protein, partial [Bacteroidota bacterium]